jgi:hypothetical protein
LVDFCDNSQEDKEEDEDLGIQMIKKRVREETNGEGLQDGDEIVVGSVANKR